MSKLSEQLFELMTEDGFTQISLAAAMNTPRTKLSMYLNDKSLPEYKYLVAIVEFFHCSADFLIGYPTIRNGKSNTNPLLRSAAV